MPAKSGIIPPMLMVHEDKWSDTPYKIILAYNGDSAESIRSHIDQYYRDKPDIPFSRRPNMIYVLGKYVIVRKAQGLEFSDRSGEIGSQPSDGSFHIISLEPDIQALMWILFEIQQRAVVAQHVVVGYENIINEVIKRVSVEK